MLRFTRVVEGRGCSCISDEQNELKGVFPPKSEACLLKITHSNLAVRVLDQSVIMTICLPTISYKNFREKFIQR